MGKSGLAATLYPEWGLVGGKRLVGSRWVSRRICTLDGGGLVEDDFQGRQAQAAFQGFERRYVDIEGATLHLVLTVL